MSHWAISRNYHLSLKWPLLTLDTLGLWGSSREPVLACLGDPNLRGLSGSWMTSPVVINMASWQLCPHISFLVSLAVGTPSTVSGKKVCTACGLVNRHSVGFIYYFDWTCFFTSLRQFGHLSVGIKPTESSLWLLNEVCLAFDITFFFF